MLKILKNQGPWGPVNDRPENNKPNNKGQNRKPNQEMDFDPEEIFKKIEDFIKGIFSNGGGNKNPNRPHQENGSPKSIIGLFILGFTLLWLSTGIYKVNPDENAAVLYFGKFYKVATPGLNYHIPYPFGKHITRSVTTVNTEEFGFSSSNVRYDNRNFDAESLMLTGDENIVDIEFQIQWKIADIYDYVFNIAEPGKTIRKAAESVMREIIARTPIADVLSTGKKDIERQAKELLQETLDSYKSGVQIELMQLRRVDPPSQVVDAFRDVQTAKADKEKEINEAEAYANDIVPRARGEASKMIEDSEAYASKVVTNAEGEAGRFISVYNQYKRAKKVTKKRIYLETMEEVLGDMDKVIIDNKVQNGSVVPYFPLNDIRKTN
ncbi:MAG: FtsH protease activity modulator HflK [Rickettsiales bacterium]|nr:FtsH protease activity modulator HflK [Rickettsiales bacterium]